MLCTVLHYSKSLLCKLVDLYHIHSITVRCDRTCVVEISVDFRQTDRSLLYNAISHDASHRANKHVQTDTFGKISMIFPPGTITMRLAQSNDATNINMAQRFSIERDRRS